MNDIKLTLDALFISACGNNLPLVKKILQDTETYFDATLHDSLGLRKAVENNNLEIIKYLLTSKEIEVHADIHAYNNAALNTACGLGYIDIVEYLLTSEDLKEKAWSRGYVSELLREQPDTIKYLDTPFIEACRGGHINVISYLLNSDAITEHCSIYAQKNFGFRNACKYNHLNVVEFILNYPGFKEHDGYSKALYEGVIVSFFNKNRDITTLLLYDYKAKMDLEDNYMGIYQVLEKFPDLADELIQDIKKRDIFQQLQIIPEKENNSKIKI